MGSRLPSDADLAECIMQLPSDAELAEFINTAEEVLFHARKVARQVQERVYRVLDQPLPEDAEGRPPMHRPGAGPSAAIAAQHPHPPVV